MTSADSPPAPPARRPAAAAKRAARGEGQWALGHREPLNPNERMKKDDDGLNVRARIENIYAHRGFASIDPADLRGRIRWWGLYTQRKPGIDGGRTAILEPHELDDEYFMLRIRIDGGQLDLAQLRAVADVSTQVRPRHRRHHRPAERPAALDPDRGRAGDLARARGASGCSTAEACGDTPAGRARQPGRRGRRRRGDRRDAGDPTRSSSGTSATRRSPTCRASSRRRSPGCPTCRTRSTTSRFLGVVHPEHGPGFDLWVGGGLSTNPMLAQRLGAWVPLDEVPEVWAGVIGDLPRLRLPAAAQPRPAEVPGRRLGRGAVPRGAGERVPGPDADRRPGAGAAGAARSTTSACTRSATAGSTSASRRWPAGSAARSLAQVADIAEAHGSGRVRLTAVPEAARARRRRRPGRVAGRGAAPRSGSRPAPSAWRRGTMACTGIEFCKLAIVETKARAADAGRARWRSASADLDADITININGCPNACARTQVADIGLKGQLVPGPDGAMVEGFQVHLGGGLGLAARARPPASAASCAASRRRRTSCPTTSSGWPAATLAGACRRRVVRPVGGPGRRGGAAMTADRRRARRAVLLPVLRRRGPAPARGQATAPGSAATCARVVLREVLSDSFPGAAATKDH